jgi:heme-degrading monooxygenase HmoA
VFVRITDVKVWPGGWPDYEAAAERLTLEGRRWAEGRKSTWLVRSIENEDSGVSIQLWASREALEAYEASDFYRTKVVGELERLLAGEFPVSRGEVRFIHEQGRGWSLRRPRW